MNEYILLMHDDVDDRAAADDGDRWGTYMSSLHQSGRFDGGSAIGARLCAKKLGAAHSASQLTGYIRVRAESLDDAKQFLTGNPVYEAGGTVEICELTKD
jgi:hypothetical protein